MCRMKKSIYFLISTLCVCFVFSFVSYFSTESYAEEYIDALSRICFRIPDDWEKEKESDFTQFGTYQAAFKPVNSNDLEFFICVDDMWSEVKEAQETGVGREYFNMEIFSVDDIVRMALNQKAIEPSSANLEKIGDKEYYVLDFDDEIEVFKVKIPTHVKMAVLIDNGYLYMYRMNMYEGLDNASFYRIMNEISFIDSDGSQPADGGFSGTRYTIPEVSLNIVIPDNYMVVTREIRDDDPIIAQFGIDRETILNSLLERNIYVDALNFSTNNEILVICKPSNIENYRDVDDSALKEGVESLKQTLADNGIEVIETDLYYTDQTKWVYRKAVTGTGNDALYQVVYYTVVNNIAYNVDMESYGLDFLPEQENMLRDIVDNCEFTAFNRSGGG